MEHTSFPGAPGAEARSTPLERTVLPGVPGAEARSTPLERTVLPGVPGRAAVRCKFIDVFFSTGYIMLLVSISVN